MGGATDLKRDLAESRAGEAALAEVLAVMSRTPPDLQAVLDTVVQRAGELCDARRNGSLFLIDGDTFHLAAGSPESSDKIRDWRELIRHPFPIERSYIVKHAFESKAVFHVRDATVEADSDDFRQDAVEFGYHTALGVPLLRGDAVIGVLSLIRPEVRPFTEREIALVRAFADQAAIAIDNTRLSTETRDALERQIAVSQVLEAMSQSTADVSIVFRTIVRSAVNLCLADNASIFRADGEVYRHVASATASGRFADEAAFERIATEAARQGRLVKERATVVGRVLLEKATVQSPDVRADPDYDNTRGLDFIAALSGTSARTVLGVPIVKGAALVGIVIARRNEVSPFSPREIDVLETFARQAAVAVENVRLFNETKEALERQTATADILRAIAGSPTDLAPVLDAIATSVVRFCGATDAQVWIKRGDDLYPEAHYGDLPRSNRPVAASADTVSGAAMLERRTIHIPDVESEAANAFPATRERFAALGQRAVLVAPLLREGSPIGTIALRKREPIPFTPNQIRLVEAFADQAVIAIENVRLFNETKEALERQTAIGDVLRVISSSPTSVEGALEAIVSSARRFCGAEDAAIGLIEESWLVNKAHDGGVGFAVGSRLPLDRGSVSGRCITDVATVQVLDLGAEAAEYPVGASLSRQFGIRTAIATPLLREGKPIGSLSLRRLEVRPFTEKQIELLRTFADQAVIAIENVRLFNETKKALEQQTATADVLKAISRSAFDLNSVFDVAVENANRLCHGDWAYVFRRDGDVFRLVATSGGLPELVAYEYAHPTSVGRSTLVGRTAIEKRPVHIPDLFKDPEYHWPPNREHGVHTVLGVPIMRGDEVVGIIGVARMQVDPFSDEEIGLVQTFADQAAIAIENVRLFNETKESLDQQTAVAHVLKVISETPFDLDPMYQAVTESAVRLCEADNATFWSGQGSSFVVRAQSGLPSKYNVGDRLTTGKSVVGMTAAARRTTHVPDATRDLSLPQDGPGTRLGVPILAEGRLLGVLGLTRRVARAFTDRQVELVETFARQAAIAIENVRLFNETKEALERQTAISEVLKTISRSAFDLGPVLEIVTENAARLAGADIAWTSRAEGDLFSTVAYSSAFPMDVRAELAAAREREGSEGWLPIGPKFGVMGIVLEDQTTVHIPDAKANPLFQNARVVRMTNARTVLGVPMMRDEGVIGGMVLARYTVRPFSDREVELVRTFVDQAAIAIENVRLFNEIQEKSRQLEVASRHKSEFLATMSHELRTPLNAIIGFSEALIEQMFGPVNPKQAEYLNDVLSSGKHLLTLINDILDLAKIEAGRMELDVDRFSLVEALQNGITMVRERASRHGIAVALDVAPDIDLIEADPRKVKQVLFNLLSNAVKFTADGGRVEVAARRANGDVVVTVRDTGIGIAPEDQERIFEEFQQARRASERSREGTGLGLALAKRFVELHGGRIWVDSAVGRGSTFTFTLPLRTPAPLRVTA